MSVEQQDLEPIVRMSSVTPDEQRVIGERVLGRQIAPDAKRHHFTQPIPEYLWDIAPETAPANEQGEA